MSNSKRQPSGVNIPLVSSIIVIEWFEFSFYLYLSSLFAKYFFPDDLSNSLLVIYLIFFVSYCARPLGAFIFGYFSDKFGRKLPLIFSALLVGASTTAIGLVPGFDSIGWLSPVLLLLFRSIQSLAVSGEFNNSAIYLIESAPTEKKLTYGSITGFSSSLGMVFGGFTAWLIITLGDDLAWRTVYVTLGLVGMIVCYMRRKLAESPEFLIFQQSAQTSAVVSLSNSIRQQWRSIIKIIAISSFMAVYIYVLNIYFSSFSVSQGWYRPSVSLAVILIAQLLTTVMVVVFAKVLKPQTYSRYMPIAILLMMLCSILLFCLGNSPVYLAIGVLIYALVNGYFSASVFYYLYKLLKIPHRCIITSVCWAVSATIFGGVSLPLSQLIVVYSGTFALVSAFCGFSLVVSVLVILLKNLEASE